MATETVRLLTSLKKSGDLDAIQSELRKQVTDQLESVESSDKAYKLSLELRLITSFFVRLESMVNDSPKEEGLDYDQFSESVE